MAKAKSTSKKTAKSKTKKTAVKKIKKPTAKKPAKTAKKTVAKKSAKKIIKKPTISIAKIRGKKLSKKQSLHKTFPIQHTRQEHKDNKITLMIVDPWKLFAYWNIDESSLDKIRGVLVLRVYDITGISFDGKNANIVFDIAVYEHAGNSYIGVGPDREFVVDIGVVLHGGGFITLARSNKITTPMLKAGRAVEEAVFSAGLF